MTRPGPTHRPMSLFARGGERKYLTRQSAGGSWMR